MPRYAAIDIGSNSIRMMAAEVFPGAPTRILAQDRQVVRLGESVFRNGVISGQAMELACSALARMAEQYRTFEVLGVRAVATSAVRDSRNQSEFLERAAASVGSPVEIISGREEARLIHLGVHARWPHPDKRALLVDIGGGSAEIIFSESGQMREAVSRPVGAVRLREMFLKNDPPAERELRQMDEYIAEKLAPAFSRIDGHRWDRSIITSATASAVLCAIHRIPRARREQADRKRASAAQVRALYRKLSELNISARRKMTGIGPSRAEIIVPGICVLLRIMEGFELPSAWFSTAGVRDGIIADLAARGVGRELSRLTREQRKEVEQLSRRYGVAPAHARKVGEFASDLFLATQPLHSLAPHYGRLLEAAAYLHDIGHFVSDPSHHKHSYYLVANSDLPGFTNLERELIANLCRYHRKALPAPSHSEFQALGADEKRAVTMLIPLLRLADSLDRSHEQRIEGFHCELRNGQVMLRLRSQTDIALEHWAAERAGDIFEQIFGSALVVSRARTTP
jgi:exopolyphosphatase/guanosine-5'-triphosphate,3'-diphosphate pyrophosphatase